IVDHLLAGKCVRPLSTAPVHIHFFQRFFEQNLVERGYCKSPNTDLKPVRRCSATMRMMLHVPEMTELMFSARGSAAGLERLHGKTAEHQSFNQRSGRSRIPGANARRVGDKFSKTGLGDLPRIGVYRLD